MKKKIPIVTQIICRNKDKSLLRKVHYVLSSLQQIDKILSSKFHSSKFIHQPILIKNPSNANIMKYDLGGH